MQRSDYAPDDVDAERPYKIFIALLDKWEIGDALAPRMILPALDSLKARQSAENDQVSCSRQHERFREATDVYRH